MLRLILPIFLKVVQADKNDNGDKQLHPLGLHRPCDDVANIDIKVFAERLGVDIGIQLDDKV